MIPEFERFKELFPSISDETRKVLAAAATMKSNKGLELYAKKIKRGLSKIS